MAASKDVLVITTSSFEGLKIQKYLKPVSAHIVAGTNLFSDFFGGITDVFGGRSQTYQKQLTSLYNEAIEKVKFAAYEIGANCIIGLSIDMDEISGKGKSMFMLTAIGTAVIIEKEAIDKSLLPIISEKFEHVGVDRINMLRSKKQIILQANEDSLELKEDIWAFITANQIDELFPYLLKKYSEALANDNLDIGINYYKSLVSFVENLPEKKKLDLLYNSIHAEKNRKIILKLTKIIGDLFLFDFDRCMVMLQSNNFELQKIGLRIACYDKQFYNKQDIKDLKTLNEFVSATFIERGIRGVKKQLLSSKEKEIWTCECGKVNDMESYCSACQKDINGFTSSEVKPAYVEHHIKQKIGLILEIIE